MLNTFGQNIEDDLGVIVRSRIAPLPPPDKARSCERMASKASSSPVTPSVTSAPRIIRRKEFKVNSKALITYLKQHIAIEDKHWIFYSGNTDTDTTLDSMEDIINSEYHRGRIEFISNMLEELKVSKEDIAELTPCYTELYTTEFEE